MLNDKEIKILGLISEDISLENYFFNKVKQLKWFYPLKEKGYFNPKNAPCPKPTDEDGYITIPLWNVLPYLEKVSKQINQPGNEKYTDDLLDIIRDISQYHINNNKCLDNYNTWSYFVKILLNIPNEQIPIDIINFVPIWLDSKYPSSFLSHDIVLELLPKFLTDDGTEEDIEKAEKIFESLFEIKWKEGSRDYLETLAGMRDEPYLMVDQHWLTESLINKENAQKIGEKCSEKPIYMLADRLKTIFRRDHSGSSFDVNIDNKAYRVVVNHTSDFEFSCFGGLIDAEAHIQVRSQEKLFRKMLYIPDKQFEFLLQNCQDAANFASQIISKLQEKRPGKLEKDFNYRMVNFYNHLINDYSYIWYRKIADVPRYIPTSVKELIAYIIREVIEAKVKIDKTFGNKIIENFLGKDFQYPLFRRIVLFIINEYWDDYNNLFNKLIESKDSEFMFDDLHYEAELFTLLKKNVRKMNEPVKSRLKQIIEKGPQRHTFDKNKEKYINLWKQKFYSALKSAPKFTKLYEQYKKLTGAEEHVFFKEPGVQTRSGPGLSPFALDDLVKKPNSEIAEILAEFKTKNWWEGPTVGGLAETIKELAKIQPEKFVDDLQPFINTAYLYIYYILWGIRDAWNNEKLFAWGKLIAFLKGYIDRNIFWQDELPIIGDDWKPDHTRIIDSIGSLIQDGTKDDAWAFEEKYNSDAQKIISLVLTEDNIDQLKTEKKSDYIMDIHNTPLGNIIIALIYLSLRIARLQDKKVNGESTNRIRWNEILKKLYEMTLEKEVIEAYTILGQYLPNIMYLDSEWVKKKIVELEKPPKKEFREAFITGYLNIVRVYDNIYQLKSMQKHYEWALETTLTKDTSEQLVHHLTIGYLRGYSELFDKMLDKWDSSQIMEIINFFWHESEYLLKLDLENRDEKMGRVINFWQKIYERYKNKSSALSDNDKKILSNATKLTVYLKAIDEEKFQWLMFSAPYVHIEGNERWLLEYLDRLKDKDDKIVSTKYILQIVLKMLKNFIYGYAQDYVTSIVTYAYELGDIDTKQIANDISNILGAAGFEYLRKVYEKYNRPLDCDPEASKIA